MNPLSASDFEDFFMYLHLEPGTVANLVLGNWEKTTNNFGKPCLRFLVVAREGVGISHPQFFETRSASIIRTLMPAMLEAQKGSGMITVTLAAKSPGRYDVLSAAPWVAQKVAF